MNDIYIYKQIYKHNTYKYRNINGYNHIIIYTYKIIYAYYKRSWEASRANQFELFDSLASLQPVDSIQL